MSEFPCNCATRYSLRRCDCGKLAAPLRLGVYGEAGVVAPAVREGGGGEAAEVDGGGSVTEPIAHHDPEWMPWHRDPAARLVLASIQARLDERNAAIRQVCRHVENQDGRTLKGFVAEAEAIAAELTWHDMAFLRLKQTREAMAEAKS